MNASEYQVKAHDFASYGENPMYPALGLSEEAGEVCGKIAKFIRKHGGIDPMTARYELENKVTITDDELKFRKDLSAELGDVMWMLAELCTNYGLDMGEVMAENIAKLTDRQERGVIVGEGTTDERKEEHGVHH